MPNKNRVELEGYVSNDPEMRYSERGTEIMTFSLATNNHYEKDGVSHSSTDFHKIVMFKRLAQKFYGQIEKGQNVAIEGRIKYNSWEDIDGKRVYYTQIVANRCHIIKSVKFEEE